MKSEACLDLHDVSGSYKGKNKRNKSNKETHISGLKKADLHRFSAILQSSRTACIDLLPGSSKPQQCRNSEPVG
ncbi:hypothetical protein, partial [Faecalibaculum rodentium]|uniref:hypothetical protein n=1 Tax=Faecalibaculum rodentium TaxID=1702221 RepID=UPI0025AE5D9D